MYYLILFCGLLWTNSSYAYCYAEPKPYSDQMTCNNVRYSLEKSPLVLNHAIYQRIYDFNYPKQYLVIGGDSMKIITSSCAPLLPQAVCQWNVIHDSLFLTAIEPLPVRQAKNLNQQTAFYKLDNLFGHAVQQNSVFADWVTDTLSSHLHQVKRYQPYRTYFIVDNGRILKTYNKEESTIDYNSAFCGTTTQDRLSTRYYSCFLIAFLLLFSRYIYTNVKP